MNLSVCRFLLPLVCLVFPVTGSSDEVFLKNGDRLTGTVKTTKDGKLIFETAYSSEIGVNTPTFFHSRLHSRYPPRRIPAAAV